MTSNRFKLISRVLTLLMIAVLFASLSAASLAQTVAEPTVIKANAINSADDLKKLAADVNAGNNMQGCIFSLQADITLNAGSFDANGVWSEAGTPEVWIPIGDACNAFSGVFLGNGYTISGLYCKSDDGFQGLFGHVINGSIEGVTVTNSYVEGGFYVGGIVGYANSVSGDNYIRNCNSTVFTKCANDFEGAIAGYVAGSYNIDGCKTDSNAHSLGGKADGVTNNNLTENIITAPGDEKSENLSWLWILLILLACLAIAVVLLLVIRKSGGNDKAQPEHKSEPEPQPEPEPEPEPEPQPEPEPEVVPIPVVTVPEKETVLGYYYIKQTANGGFMFNLKAANHEIIATSEVYTTLSGCKKGISSVAKSAAAAEVDDMTDSLEEKIRAPKFDMYIDKAGKYRFRLKAGNYEIIAVSQAYSSKSGCKNGIDSVRKNSQTTKIIIEDADTGERIQKLRAELGKSAKVTVEEAKTLIDDETAEALIEQDAEDEIWEKQACEIINIDTISDSFEDGDTVDAAALAAKGLVPKSTEHIKVLARGTLDKALTVKANQFSADAVKMIVLVGGNAIRTNK